VVFTPCKLLICIKHSYLFVLKHLQSWATMFSIFVIFEGIFGLIFDFTIWGVFLWFLMWIWVLGRASLSTSNLEVNTWLYPLQFHGFLLVSPKPRFLSSSKIRRKIIGFGKNTLLRTCSLHWGDPCVQVSSYLVPYSSRIKLRKEGRDFGRKSCFLETSYRTIFGPTWQCPTWPKQCLSCVLRF
jgi:hypothetical protein